MKTVIGAWKQVSEETIKHSYACTALLDEGSRVDEEAAMNAYAHESLDLNQEICESLLQFEIENPKVVQVAEKSKNCSIRQFRHFSF
jgi:hypothetical protein